MSYVYKVSKMKTYPVMMNDDTHKKLKLNCFQRGITIKEFFDNCVEDFLKENKKNEVK